MGYDSTDFAAVEENGGFLPNYELSAKIGHLKNGGFPPFFGAIRKLPPLPTLTVSLAMFALTACGTPTPHPTTPGEHVVFRDVKVEVPRPCPVKKPARPAKLRRPLPTDPAALAELAIAKLLEWDGPGGFGDKALDALDTCLKP